MTSMKTMRWLVLLLALGLLAGAGWWWWTQWSKADAVQYRTGKIERGPLQATVSASGAVNPVTQVSVGTQISGQIKELLVDFNTEVKAGQLIALIDPETFEYRVRSAQADVDAARATVLTAQANVAASNAQVSRAKVDLIEAQRDLDRKQSLVQRQFIAQSEADRARALVNTSNESVKAAEAQLAVTGAQVKSAQANVAQREATLAQARVDLQRTRITSPVDGIVIKRTIEKGQTVAASLQSPELFVIARNLRDMQVDASIDESDVGRIRNGQKASFTVDAFPGATFDGQVTQVRKAAQNVANVVTYTAVVAFSNSDGRLLPGMTANVRVVTEARESVLKVPNAALRVRLTGVEPPAGAASGAPAGAGQGPANGMPAPAGAASVPATGASRPGAATTTGDAASPLRGWSLFSQAFAQQGGGGMAAQRERLIAELQLSAEQQSRLSAIGEELRPQFLALRDLPEAERAAQRDKLVAQMRQKINAMLDAGQRAKYAQMAPGAAGGQGAAGGAAAAPATAAATPARAASTTARAGVASAQTPAGPAAAAAPAGAAAAGAAPGGPGGGGPLMEMRNRLLADLQLSTDQLAKVDALLAETRTRYMALRELAAEERTKARDRITADLRARIGDLLTPEQKQKYAVVVAETAGRAVTRGRIYLLDAQGKPKAYNVRLGISDGTSTELIVSPGSPQAAELVEGATVITGTAAPTSATPAARGPRFSF
jgi:HlyD family secretion protein